jgi:hypothetical protein
LLVNFAAIPISKGTRKGYNTAYLGNITVVKHVPYVNEIQEEFEFGEDEAPTKEAEPKSVGKKDTPAEDTFDFGEEDEE